MSDGGSADRSAIVRTIGSYRILEELGRGAMGIVYLGEDLRLRRKVALKALSAALGGDTQSKERLRREAWAAAALAHSGIATVFALEKQENERALALPPTATRPSRRNRSTPIGPPTSPCRPADGEGVPHRPDTRDGILGCVQHLQQQRRPAPDHELWYRVVAAQHDYRASHLPDRRPPGVVMGAGEPPSRRISAESIRLTSRRAPLRRTWPSRRRDRRSREWPCGGGSRRQSSRASQYRQADFSHDRHEPFMGAKAIPFRIDLDIEDGLVASLVCFFQPVKRLRVVTKCGMKEAIVGTPAWERSAQPPVAFGCIPACP